MEQLSGLQLQKLILNKGNDCRSDRRRESKGEGGKGQNESGLIVAAAGVGGLSRRWETRRGKKRQREVCLSSRGSICLHFWSLL